MSSESVIRRLIAEQGGRTASGAFEAGYDSVVSGANQINCHFGWFATEALKNAWERGARKARTEKAHD